MPELGEVREFALGYFASREIAPGLSKAVMQTEQRVWDGERWCVIGTPECAAVLSRVCKMGVAAA